MITDSIPAKYLHNLVDLTKTEVISCNLTFHIWPIACSLFAEDITATVDGQNNLRSTNTTSSQRHGSLTVPPYQRPAPTKPLEYAWYWIFRNAMQLQQQMIQADFSNHRTFTWLELSLSSILNVASNASTAGMNALEAEISSFAALSYASLIHEYHDFLQAKHDSLVAHFAVPDDGPPRVVTVTSTSLFLVGKLNVNPPQLLLGIGLVITLMGATLAIIFVGNDGVNSPRPGGTSDGIACRGGAIDLMACMHNSSLPTLLTNGGTITSSMAIRQRAEETYIS